MLDICSSHTLSCNAPPIVVIHKREAVILPTGGIIIIPKQLRLDFTDVPSMYHEFLLKMYLK